MNAVTHETIAEALRTDPSAPLVTPTDEQRRVIEAPPAPSLVVAGAGSGKTQTMVQRMVWLVAVEGVAPSELLGLTFTRKAAGELRERVDAALRRLRAAGLVTCDETELPEVSTYNAFAHGIFREHALLIGREPDSLLLDDAAAFTIMRRVALRSDDTSLGDLDLQLASIVEGALDLTRAMRDNGASVDDIESIADRLDALLELPLKRKGAFPLGELKTQLGGAASLRALARLSVAYEAEKRARGLIEFSDQVAGALEICQRAPSVVDLLRDRHRHVILDEYQDTSVGQTRLLATLFGGTSLMAVGDPKQSIYGWRGASAANMSRFARDFGAGADAVFTLSTSWRNDRAVLAAANAVAAPLGRSGSIALPELAARRGAGEGTVVSTVTETLDEEVSAIADHLAAVFADATAREADPPTAAVLFRTRKLMSTVARELGARGVPARIVGLGGLLSTPEITDLTSVLRASRDPGAGGELIRLLAGARAQLGAADIAELSRIARSLAAATSTVPLDHGGSERLRLDLGAETEAMLADAVAFVAERPEHPLLGALTPEARRRTADIAALLDDVRDRAGLPLVDLVEYAIRRAALDLETAANTDRPEASANLDAFLDHVVGFQAVHGGSADLGAFLDWVEAAGRRDDLAPASIEPQPGAVQLLTIHASKGLEWDLVVVPRLVEGGLPSSSKEGFGWLKRGALPYPLRLDASDLPAVALTGHDTQQDARDAFTQLKADVAERFELEERRLAYVAFTRARSRLVLTASYWGTGKKPWAASRFLLELVEAGILPAPPARVNGERPDSADRVERLAWPREPMRARDAEALRRVALDVRAGLDAIGRGEPRPTPWDRDIELLLRERESAAAPRRIAMPARLAASHFKDLVLDPAAAAAQWRRPMPQRPFRQTRLGTMFHAWVEQRSGAPAGGGDLLDGGPLDLDPGELALLGLGAPGTADDERLVDLQRRFERSGWAARRPIAVEQTIEVALGGRTVVCKLDAVYEGDDGVIEIVDWKTGAAPKGARAEWERQLQLALYTLAYSRHHGIDPGRIRAVLFYVADGEAGTEYRFDHVTDAAELERLLRDAEAAIASADAAKGGADGAD